MSLLYLRSDQFHSNNNCKRSLCKFSSVQWQKIENLNMRSFRLLTRRVFARRNNRNRRGGQDFGIVDDARVAAIFDLRWKRKNYLEKTHSISSNDRKKAPWKCIWSGRNGWSSLWVNEDCRFYFDWEELWTSLLRFESAPISWIWAETRRRKICEARLFLEAIWNCNKGIRGTLNSVLKFSELLIRKLLHDLLTDSGMSISHIDFTDSYLLTYNLSSK